MVMPDVALMSAAVPYGIAILPWLIESRLSCHLREPRMVVGVEIAEALFVSNSCTLIAGTGAAFGTGAAGVVSAKNPRTDGARLMKGIAAVLFPCTAVNASGAGAPSALGVRKGKARVCAIR